MRKHERKTGDLIRTFGDFWLGMAGAAAKGVSTFSTERRNDKKGNEPDDFFGNAALAVGAMFEEASLVAKATRDEIRVGEQASDGHRTGPASGSSTAVIVPPLDDAEYSGNVASDS